MFWAAPSLSVWLWRLQPTEGMLPLEQQPWSDSYWPLSKGGIAFRWNQPNAVRPENYTRFDQKQLLGAGSDLIRTLSPAEKLDLLMGRYNLPLTHKVLSKYSPYAASWTGICDGWSEASLNFPEPHPTSLLNPDGISIEFGSSDIKALLSYYYAHAKLNVWQLGRSYGATENDAQDVNAGAFHVALTNQIGILHQGFIAEIDPGVQAWNQPVFGYTSRVLQRVPGRTLVETTMMYANEISPNWNGNDRHGPAARGQKVYRYWLDLNAAGDITGGDWEQSDHPDYLWKLRKPLEGFKGEFSGLNALLKR
jgi:hypothetical protein